MSKAQALLKPQNFFTDDREPEVPRLDYAGMNGADRNLVYTIAGNTQEWIMLLRVVESLRAVKIPSQGKGRIGPSAVAKPRPLIAGLGRLNAEQIKHGALHTGSYREHAGKIGKAWDFYRRRRLCDG